MKIDVIIMILLAAFTAAFCWVQYRKGERAAAAAAGPLRTDLLFGYYGCAGSQAAEVKAHTNLHWEAFFEGVDKGIANIKAMACTTVIDVAFALFERPGPSQPVTRRANAPEQLHGLFMALRAAGVLHHVKFVVPIDEPNLPENAAIEHMPWAVELIRRAASGYPELAGVKLACIYYNENGKSNYPGADLFDLVGLDDYDAGARVLAPGGSFDRLRSRLTRGQRLILVPGGSYGQDPEPFLRYAHAHADVCAIVPFLWQPPAGADMQGIRALPVRAAYEAAGAALVTGAA